MAPAPVRTAVIPVAGLGTRFLPVTKAVPKELLPVVDRPCIDYVVAEAVACGIERIVFVTAEGKEGILRYFDRSPSLEAHLEARNQQGMLGEVRRIAQMADIVAIRQVDRLGLGHAVRSAAPALRAGEDVAVLLGDEIFDSPTPALAQLLAARTDTGAEGVVGLVEIPLDQTHRYGICAGSLDAKGRMRIERMVEKPASSMAPSNLAIVGKYILPARLFAVLETTPPGAGGEVQLTDAIAVLARDGGVIGQVLDGVRHDTGNVIGLLRASLHYAWKRPDLRPEIEALIAEFDARR